MCTHTMRSLTCVLVVVCVACKLRPCPSCSRRRDRINLGLLRSYYKGGGCACQTPGVCSLYVCYANTQAKPMCLSCWIMLTPALKEMATQ